MKAFVHIIAVILLFASFCQTAVKGNGMEMSSMVDSVGSDYTANATAIEQKKQEMLVGQSQIMLRKSRGQLKIW